MDDPTRPAPSPPWAGEYASYAPSLFYGAFMDLRITPVVNGWVVAPWMADYGVSSAGETHVFTTADALANWIRMWASEDVKVSPAS